MENLSFLRHFLSFEEETLFRVSQWNLILSVDSFVVTHGEILVFVLDSAVEMVLIAGLAGAGFDLERAEGDRAA